MSNFLTDLFRSSDPNQNVGADVSAREVLDRGYERLADLDDQRRAEGLAKVALALRQAVLVEVLPLGRALGSPNRLARLFVQGRHVLHVHAIEAQRRTASARCVGHPLRTNNIARMTAAAAVGGHATRTLVKTGHPDVFGLLGYTKNPKLDFQSLEVSPEEICLGETIEFNFQLQSTNPKPQTVVIDYAVHHMKANGRTSPKVFKFRTLEIAPGESLELSKRHAIKPITTRKYHPGEHAVEILINGKTFGRAGFTLRPNN